MLIKDEYHLAYVLVYYMCNPLVIYLKGSFNSFSFYHAYLPPFMSILGRHNLVGQLSMI